MVGQYPHKLELHVLQDAISDGKGGFTAAEPFWKPLGECRYQPNGAGKEVRTEDGATVVFGAVVHMPLSMVEPITYKDDVRVLDKDDKVVGKGEVMRFSRDLMHCRLWL